VGEWGVKIHTRSSSNASELLTWSSFCTGTGIKPRTRSEKVFQSDLTLCNNCRPLASQCLQLSKIFCEQKSLFAPINANADGIKRYLPG
jgi:hypothetical protein